MFLFKKSFNLILLFAISACVTSSDIIWSLKCEAKCANNSPLITVNNEAIVPNGCGTFGLTVDFDKFSKMDGFNECCNQHDICYRTCNETKVSCDDRFESCLKSACLNNGKYLVCRGLAKLMYEAVENLGCIPYIKDVNNFCGCSI